MVGKVILLIYAPSTRRGYCTRPPLKFEDSHYLLIYASTLAPLTGMIMISLTNLERFVGPRVTSLSSYRVLVEGTVPDPLLSLGIVTTYTERIGSIGINDSLGNNLSCTR